MNRNNDPFFDEEEKAIDPVDAAAQQLMDEAVERNGGVDLRTMPSYRWATAADEEDNGY